MCASLLNMTLKGSYPVSNISKKMKGRLEFDVQAWSHAISKFEEYIQLRNIMKYAVIFVIDTICRLVVAVAHIYLLSFDSICSIGYCGTSYGAEISFDVWRRLGWSSSVFPATKIFAISRNSLLGMPFPLTSPTALRLLTSNPAGLSLPNQRIEIC